MIHKHEFQLAAKAFRAGRLSLAQFTAKVFASNTPQNSSPLSKTLAAPTPPSSIPLLPDRKADTHKGDYGRILLIGGSSGMGGAIGLAALGALRSGAGLVTVGIPANLQTIVAGFSPCFMTLPCSDDMGNWGNNSWIDLERGIAWADVLAIGPGMGRGMPQQEITTRIFQHATQPVVVDADALHALAASGIDLKQHAGARILTPHGGEFDRIVASRQPVDHISTTMDQSRRESTAIQLAADSGTIIVLKGHQTLVTNGEEAFYNTTGNPGMATGGTGDVLTGVIAALLGQKLNPWQAAKLAVHSHGLAADLAVAETGMVSLIATDLVERLPAAFLDQRGQKTAGQQSENDPPFEAPG